MATDRDGLVERPLAAYEKLKASDSSSMKLTAPFLPSSSMSEQPPAARVDVTDAAQVEAEVAAVAAAFRSIDVLLYYAGIPAAIPAMEQDLAKGRSVLEVNATGSFICSTAVARQAV